MACVHGLYDTLLAVDLRQAAGVLMSGLVIALLLVDRDIDPSASECPQVA
jgi:hypothetical protein